MTFLLLSLVYGPSSSHFLPSYQRSSFLSTSLAAVRQQYLVNRNLQRQSNCCSGGVDRRRHCSRISDASCATLLLSLLSDALHIRFLLISVAEDGAKICKKLPVIKQASVSRPFLPPRRKSCHERPIQTRGRAGPHKLVAFPISYLPRPRLLSQQYSSITL
jgi:hypothetical protein